MSELMFIIQFLFLLVVSFGVGFVMLILISFGMLYVMGKLGDDDE